MVKIICTENNGVNKTEVELSGDLDIITAQISYAIASMYTKIREQDKNAAEEFRVKLIRAIASKDSPVWKRATYEYATCRAAIVRKGAKLTGDDIADLLRRGTPKNIVKALLNEMDG